MLKVGNGLQRGFIAALVAASCQPAGAQGLTIEQLLKDGWEIAGFAPAQYVLGSVMLFKHKDRNYFVQCSAVYDATRSANAKERVVTNCYEIH